MTGQCRLLRASCNSAERLGIPDTFVWGRAVKCETPDAWYIWFRSETQTNPANCVLAARRIFFISANTRHVVVRVASAKHTQWLCEGAPNIELSQKLAFALRTASSANLIVSLFLSHPFKRKWYYRPIVWTGVIIRTTRFCQSSTYEYMIRHRVRQDCISPRYGCLVWQSTAPAGFFLLGRHLMETIWCARVAM